MVIKGTVAYKRRSKGGKVERGKWREWVLMEKASRSLNEVYAVNVFSSNIHSWLYYLLRR